MARILIADDSKEMRELLSALLTAEKHEVVLASDGAQALSMARNGEHDLLILDVMMPRLDGFSVVKETRAMQGKRDLKILMLTAKAAESDIVTGYRLGADGYLTKPFSPDELIRTIESILVSGRGELQGKTQEELERAQLLERLESLFS